MNDTVSSDKASICLEVNLRDPSTQDGSQQNKIKWWAKRTHKDTMTYLINSLLYFATHPELCVCECVCVRKKELKSERDSRGWWHGDMTLEPLLKMKYHSSTAAIKACHSSITQMYQDIKHLTDVKGGKEHVEMRRDGFLRWKIDQKGIYILTVIEISY